jgi:HNH endonuclease/AP2 domain
MAKQILIEYKGKAYVISVDDDCYGVLSRHSWRIIKTFRGKMYVFTELGNRSSTRRMIYMHQMVCGSYSHVDHKDGDTFNNKAENLRPATKSQNGANSKKMKLRKGKPTSSKYKGVHYSKSAGKYIANVYCDGKRYGCGSFDNEIDAARAYNKKAKELFGEFALLNKINLEA